MYSNKIIYINSFVKRNSITSMMIFKMILYLKQILNIFELNSTMNKILISATALSALAISTLSSAVFADNTTNPSLPSSYQQTGVQNLTATQRTSLKALRASWESDIKTIRDSYKPTVDSSGIITASLTTDQLTSLKASLDTLKTTYTDKVNALGITDATSSTYILNEITARIDRVYTNLSNLQVGNKLPVENQGNRMKNKGMNHNGWNKNQMVKPAQIQTNPAIEKAVDKILSGKDTATQTSILSDLQAKVETVLSTYQAKTDAYSVTIVTLLNQLSTSIDNRIEFLNLTSPVLDVINFIYHEKEIVK